jgi:signal transduction histidine kinase/ligand-binding sensor domain-containing protein/DNA-binding NarL/FixJ family response regulator/HPt (histidine-containing phosphotransfer) domain-containing protein
VYQPVPGKADSLASLAARTLMIDRKGRVWIGTLDAGVDILDPASGRVQHLRHDDASANSLSSDKVYTLRQDRGGDVWIGTDAGLDRWHQDSGSISRLGEHGSILRSQVSQLLESADGLWVGSYDAGLARIDGEGRVVRQHRHDDRAPHSLASDDVRALLQDASGNLWVGTASGLDLIEPGAGGFLHYRRDAADAATLRDDFIMSLYQDPTGLVWIGTRGGGVSRWNPRSWEMGGSRPQWLREQYVMGFADAPGRQVWIASLAGLYRYDTQTGEATGIDEVLGRRNALGDSNVTALRQDHAGTLWIGTARSGLRRLGADNRLASFPVAPGRPRSLSAKAITSIVESRSGRMWIGTFGGGVNVLDPATGDIRQLAFGPEKANAVSGANVLAILEDTRGNLWLGTEGEGLSVVDAEGRLLRRFRHDAADATSLPSDVVYSLALDQHGRVWIGTPDGLARAQDSTVDPARQELTSVPVAAGQGSELTYAVIGDSMGGIWISGAAGLVHLDPDSGATRVYHREDGLQGEEFTSGAAQRLRDGRLCFGGTGGFNIFDPQALSGAREPPRLLLTGARVLGEAVKGDTPVWAREGLSLKYRETNASLDFSVLDYAAPGARLSYRVAGFIDQPVLLDAGQSIQLAPLPAGDHVLEVRAASADSPWSEPLRFTLHRDAHPLLTPWAWATYALLLAMAIAARVRHQRRKFQAMQRARDHLEAQVKERTIELVESNRQLAEAARAKSDFLDRMSHELRTPMNGVVGMTELLSRTALSATQTHLTRTIRSSAQILLQIVNDLLDLSKIRAGKVQLEALPVDIGQVLEECTSLFAGAAEAKGLELIVCPPAHARRGLRGDPLRVRQVLMNLVGNAVKFTSQGEIVVRADVEPQQGDDVMVRLSVSDTGIGIDDAVLAKIFEPFTQADEKTTRQFGGTGLGLAICRELAELMGGRISVESRQQVGSTFTLHLPMQLGAQLPEETSLPSASARLYTRRPALAESLQRHCAALGISLAWEQSASETRPAGLLLVDAGTQPQLLANCLAQPELCRGSLLVVATPAEVERLGLRLLLPERAVILKPVHHVAVREALASALGAPSLVQPEAQQPARQAVQGHVLLVEDDEVNAMVAQGYLAEIGCTSAWVTSAEAAIARSQTEHFDLVFMDLNMSDMDGFAATARIRQREAGKVRVPIVALTAHDAHSYRERVLAAGMDDILSKPYTLQDCRAMLARWIVQQEPAVESAAVPMQSSAGAMESIPQPALAMVGEADAGIDVEGLASIDEAAVRTLGQLGTGGPTALYGRLVAMFESSSRSVMSQLGVALDAGDLAKAADLCHRLKSSSANVGASAFASALRELESRCRAADGAAALQLYRQLEQAHPLLLEALRERSMAATA